MTSQTSGNNPPADRLVEVVEARARLGNLSHTKIMALIASGELPSVKLGRRRLIRESRLVEFMAALESASSRSERPCAS